MYAALSVLLIALSMPASASEVAWLQEPKELCGLSL